MSNYDTVTAKINNGDYVTKLPYPERLAKPSLPARATAAQAREYADKLEAYEASVDAHQKARQDHRNDTYRLEQVVLRADLEVEYGLTDHPKADKVWNKAWEHGHSNGLNEVAYWYDEFAELVL